jgi:hypothetical protein
MNSEENRKRIIEYYNYTLPFYKFFWHKGKSHAIHYGFNEDGTKDVTLGQLNFNRFLADQINVKKTI